MRDLATALLVYFIKCLNPYKDRRLSRKLHNLADEYNTRPTGEWR